jgi:hypothetical protein
MMFRIVDEPQHMQKNRDAAVRQAVGCTMGSLSIFLTDLILKKVDRRWAGYHCSRGAQVHRGEVE